MLSPNTILRGRYRIIHELGHGGMGAVYQAMDENLSRVVAVKETFATTPEQRRAFKREAELLANLSHPVLPTVSEHFEHADGQFLVMQFVPGHDLAELLDLREQPFAEAKVLAWADQILDALEDLHSCSPPIIHRDIKPSNLKVTPKGKIMLLDFGLAKGVAGQMSTLDSQGKSIFGYTPVYAPLEQIHGRGTDPRSDLYALGATLYHLLTGQPPVDAPARYTAIEEEQPDPLSPVHELNSQVSLSVSTIIAQAMSMNRRQRPTGATEVRAALRSAAEEGGKYAADQRGLQEAETRRKEEEAARRDEDEARKKAEQERLRKESDARRLAEERERAEKEAARRMEAAQRRAEEQRRRESERQPQKTIPAPYMPQPTPFPEPGGRSTDPSRSMETMPPLDSSVKTKSNRRAIFAVVIAIVSVSAIGFFMWSLLGGQTQSSTQPPVVSEKTQPVIPPAPAGMVYVPGGEFTMGHDDGDEYERPAHRIEVKPFFIDAHELTNEDYLKFVRATGRQPPPGWTNTYPAGAEQKPVGGINWDAAVAYARWANKRLPTEEEWEFAARGTDGRRYPWGDNWNTGLANADSASNALADAGSFKGSSPFGLVDMVGNAWEWTASELSAYPNGSLPIKPGTEMRVIRGGSYESDSDTATTTYRRGYPARGNYDYGNTGFRCAKDVPDSRQ